MTEFNTTFNYKERIYLFLKKSKNFQNKLQGMEIRKGGHYPRKETPIIFFKDGEFF